MNEGNGEFKGQMKQWVKHFEKQREEDVENEKERHTELLDKFDGYHKDIQAQFTLHKEYHKDNEHKWGIWSLMKRKPGVAVLIGVIISGSLATAGYNLKDILKALIAFAK